MKAIILSLFIGFLSFTCVTTANAQTGIDSTLYVVTLVNGNEYTGFIISDDGREVLMETENLGKIYIPKSDVARMNKKLKVDQILNNKYQSVITLNDGSEIIGRILSDDGKEIVLETDKLGKVYLDKKDVSNIQKKVASDEIINGQYQAEGPFTTRYSFTNNALPIKKGENYAMVHLYGPEAHFAVTNRLNIGVMATWIGSPLALAMKYTFKTKESRVNFSLGSIVGTSGYIRNFAGFGSLNWGSMTLGDRKNNLTISGGYGFVKSNIETYDINGNQKSFEKMNKGPVFSVAGIVRVGAKASLIFDMIHFSYTKEYDTYENHYDHNTGTSTNIYKHIKDDIKVLLLMPGLRYQKTPKKAFQVSLAGISVKYSYQPSGNNYYNPNRNKSIPIPMCSWFYKF